jgi:hypothetical protein
MTLTSQSIADGKKPARFPQSHFSDNEDSFNADFNGGGGSDDNIRSIPGSSYVSPVYFSIQTHHLIFNV